MKLTEKQIDEISQQLEAGMKAYINKETGEMKFILDWDEMYGETDMWEKDLEEIEKNWKEYVTIEKMSSRESYRVMESFIDKVTDQRMRQRLADALNGRGAFSRFKNTLHYDEEIRQQWFKHKSEEYITYVRYYLEGEFELPQPQEKAAKQTQSFNLNGRSFELKANSANGLVDSKTVFEFEQQKDLVTADYHGGSIVYGKIIGKLEGEKLQLVYQCLTADKELKSGQGVGQLTMTEEGKIRLLLNWEWLGKTGQTGSSEYVES